MFKELILKGQKIKSPFLLAPMAGITNSAFRRLLSEYGGYGALFSEMLSPNAFLNQDCTQSPFTKRHENKSPFIFQFRLNGDEDIVSLLKKVALFNPFAIDINLGCPAPNIRQNRAGVALFSDIIRLEKILSIMREHWNGILTVKCRLGNNSDNWQKLFLQRLKLFEKYNIDMLSLHPRFATDKLKRRARWETFEWVANNTDIPLIANGDIVSPQQIIEKRKIFSKTSGLMLGRITVARPWIFRKFNDILIKGIEHNTHDIDYYDIWQRFYDYTCQDFIPEKAIGRIKEFSSYFARNFLFGHSFFSAILGSKDCETARERALLFLEKKPETVKEISFLGV